MGIDADWFGCNTLLLPDREEEAVAAAADRTPWLRLLFLCGWRLAAGGPAAGRRLDGGWRQTADLSVDSEHSMLQKSHF